MTTIASVSVQALDLPLAEPFEISLGRQTAAENVLVTVETESGTMGYGEGSPLPPVTGETQSAVIETVRAAAPLLEGADLTNSRSLLAEVRQSFPGKPSALFAVETAVLDAYCRERDLALAELFGGAPELVETDLTIPLVDTEEARDRARRAISAGYDYLKIKTGSDVTEDIGRLLAVREVAPNAVLKVDANQGWTVAETVRFDHEMRERGIDLALIEQPVRHDDVSGLARVREKIITPVAADEAIFTPADALRVVRAEAADVLNIKLGKSGLMAAADIAAIARAANLECMVGCMLESAVGIHTSAHVVSGLGSFAYVDLDGNRLLAEDVIESERGPKINISGPGHGVEPTLPT